MLAKTGKHLACGLQLYYKRDCDTGVNFARYLRTHFHRTPWGDCFLKQQQPAEYSLFCTSGQEMWYSSQIPDNQYYA